LRQGQGERDLVGCELGGKLPGRVTIALGIIHDAAAASELGDRRQFLRLSPRGELAPSGDAVDQARLVLLARPRLTKPGGQAGTGLDAHVTCDLRARHRRPSVRLGGTQLVLGQWVLV